jgi:dolichol-phosphate mannosyltransferase
LVLGILMKKTAIFVIPTYNERDNIAHLVKQINFQVSKLNNWDYKILIVDDFSADDTGKIVSNIIKINSKVALISKKKEGLGSAYIKGFKYVIKNYQDADCVFQMDADLSHDPKYIKNFIEEFGKGSQLIVGSRYVEGGKIYLSKTGNKFFRFLLKINYISDFTSGYRCIDMKILKNFNLDRIKAKSFAIMPNILLETIRNNKIVKEIPIVFTNRKNGNSKIRIYDFFENLYILLHYFFIFRFTQTPSPTMRSC